MLTRHRQMTFISVLTTVVMFGLIFAYWYKEQKETAEKREQVFAESTDQAINIIHQKLYRFELTLRGVKGFYESSGFVTKDEYRGYVDALQLSETVSGLQALAIALNVPQQDKTAHLADILHRGGVIGYRIKPDGEREDYAPIALIEPYSGSNLNAVGYDLKSNPATKLALHQARDTGEMALSGKVSLVQDAGQDIPASVMYVPIYDRNMDIDTLEGRRKALVGWVSGPFRIGDLIAGLDKQLDNDVGINIYDGENHTAATLLYTSGVGQGQSDLRAIKVIDIGGRRWTLDLCALPAFNDRFPESIQLQIVAGGVTLSLLLGWLVWLLGSGRARAETMANEMTQELQEAQKDLQCTLNAMPDLLFELDLEGRYYNFHSSQESLLVVKPDQILGKKISDVLSIEATEICLAALQEANQTGFSSGKQIEILLDQEPRWFELSIARKDGGASKTPRFVMISRDITERKLSSNQLRIAAIAFESQEGMIVTDDANIILRVNQSFTDITGYSAEEAVGQSPSMLKSGQHDQHFYAVMWDSINHHGEWAGEIWNRRKSGEIYPEHLTITAVKDVNDIVTNYVATMTDITKSKQALDEINMLAFYDPLTHLANRRLLIDRLAQALASSTRTGQKGALLFLDLDHFKTLNDTLGHDVGDMLLQQVAERLLSVMREGDTVARLGGDEFVVLLESLADDMLAVAARVESIAEKITATIRQPYFLGTHETYSTISIGVTLFDGQDFGTDDLLKQADIAMYEAKSAGRNTLRFFDLKMQIAIAERVELEEQLRKAIELQQFKLHYQIQVGAAGQALGAEALIRWEHPERGLISPFHFIPLAEETGLILPIGQWVLDSACARLKLWEQNESTRQLRLSVNVSARQFHQPDFADQVQATVLYHAIDPSLLNLELTESMLLDDVHGMISSMEKLRKIGVRFELDDFGTGYSSLQYLKKLPLYQLKIDQSFVRDISVDHSDRALVSTIISMAHSLDLHVIAEGVETEAQLEFLKHHKCDHYQGYLFSKPLPVEQFELLVKEVGGYSAFRAS